MTGEEIVPIESTEGNVKIPIINKEQLERQLKNIKEKEKIAYVHISTIQFLLKGTFAQGIDSPVQLEIRDDRLRDLNDALIARGRGNLKETKMKFDINIQVGMSLYDINLSDSITIRYKLLRTNFMKKGNHPFSITYQINYALSNSHHSITFKNDSKISIDKLFRPVIELEENKSNGIFGRKISRIVEDTDNFENKRNARTSTSRQGSFLGPPAFDDSHNNELVKQSLVTNLNMEKQLNELSKAPIEIRLGFMQTPGLPKDGKCISLPRNLLPETQYVLSSSSGSRVSEQVCYVQATFNNITEILSWIALHQTTEHNQANIERSENIAKLLEKQFTKIIEILEQNKKDIKNELEIIQKIDDQRYETIFANQQRIINLFLEKAPREEENKQLDTEIRELKDIITELRKEYKYKKS
ncbi:transport protein [Artemisia annua]|uniref:Transport protein n=1 Tax=Artemisia annua TaxID=35608 RepID=A0A2U1MLG7_ARTAN|nr:transport protein [Artemisia annua]